MYVWIMSDSNLKTKLGAVYSKGEKAKINLNMNKIDYLD